MCTSILKPWISKALPIITSLLLAFLLVFATGCSKTDAPESSQAEEQSASNSSNASDLQQNDGEANPNEPITFTDAKVELTGTNAPKVTCVVNNNTDSTYIAYNFGIEGKFTAPDNYGDDEEHSEFLDLEYINVGRTGPTDRIGNSLFAFAPGKRTYEFMPTRKDGIVASVENQRGSYDFTLEDMDSVTVRASHFFPSGSNDHLLNEDDYEVVYHTKVDNGNNTIYADITNKTDERWRDVYIHFIPVMKDGSIGEIPNDEFISNVVSNKKTLVASYVNTGETKTTNSMSYPDNLEFDHFETIFVYAIVENN